jgi:ribonuclease HII
MFPRFFFWRARVRPAFTGWPPNPVDYFARPAQTRSVASARKQAVEPPDRFEHERALLASGCLTIAGVDEAGRGPLAGPVVAAAVILPSHWIRDGLPGELRGLNDSKQLSEARREEFAAWLRAGGEVRFAIVEVSVEEIDRLNILRATHRAMARALARLTPPPDHILVDGLPVASLPFPQTAIIKGDARSYSIAAASVLAKVHRDRLMRELDAQFPRYGFGEHKGYGTPAHLARLAEHGPCPAHRRSFAPVRLKQSELFPA